MKALSVVSPGGARIAAGRKTLEVRRWAPDLGPGEDLLIVENDRWLAQTSVAARSRSTAGDLAEPPERVPGGTPEVGIGVVAGRDVETFPTHARPPRAHD